MKPGAKVEAGAKRREPGETDRCSLIPKQRVHEELGVETRIPRGEAEAKAEAEAWHREPGRKKIQKLQSGSGSGRTIFPLITCFHYV